MTLYVGKFGLAEDDRVEAVERPVLARWVTTCTLWHPTYRQHLLVAITLADVEPLSSPPPNVLVSGATHAIASATIDPAHPFRDDEPVQWMRPMNFEVQFACPSDERATAALGACAEEVVNGRLNPESGNAPNLNHADWREFIEGVLE